MAAPRVFIAYASEDYDVATRLADALDARGARVFEFKRSAVPGTTAWREVVENIRASDWCVVLVSGASAASVPVSKEVEEAYHWNANTRRPALVPAMLEDASKDALLAAWTEVDFRDRDAGIAALARRLELGGEGEARGEEEADAVALDVSITAKPQRVRTGETVSWVAQVCNEGGTTVRGVELLLSNRRIEGPKDVEPGGTLARTVPVRFETPGKKRRTLAAYVAGDAGRTLVDRETGRVLVTKAPRKRPAPPSPSWTAVPSLRALRAGSLPPGGAAVSSVPPGAEPGADGPFVELDAAPNVEAPTSPVAGMDAEDAATGLSALGTAGVTGLAGYLACALVTGALSDGLLDVAPLVASREWLLGVLPGWTSAVLGGLAALAVAFAAFLRVIEDAFDLAGYCWGTVTGGLLGLVTGVVLLALFWGALPYDATWFTFQLVLAGLAGAVAGAWVDLAGSAPDWLEGTSGPYAALLTTASFPILGFAAFAGFAAGTDVLQTWSASETWYAVVPRWIGDHVPAWPGFAIGGVFGLGLLLAAFEAGTDEDAILLLVLLGCLVGAFAGLAWLYLFGLTVGPLVACWAATAFVILVLGGLTAGTWLG